MSTKTEEPPAFDSLGLHTSVLSAVKELGYESPSPIQAAAIPPFLEGKDILGQAQTGTGKTAAFALPLLTSVDLSLFQPQVLVLAPTRELAIQVAEAFQRYASHMPKFRVTPIYGGQDYRQQFRALVRGVHVVVGTPGRVMDHMRRGSLKLDSLKTIVLDEGDEMLRMGFIEDVEWVLSQIPHKHQTALFSATIPKEISHIVETHLNDPVHVRIKEKTTTASTVRQRYWVVSGLHKLDALTRILEVEEIDGVIIFVRTKIQTVELAEKLSARGFAAQALNGDISQGMREKTVNRLKAGQLDILVATDVAARGLDVPRISHVVNYDVPYDSESYVHRIGRTGRAGRDGDAILFISPREKRLLKTIERSTRQGIERMDLPSAADINTIRVERFKQRIADTMANATEFDVYRDIVESFRLEYAAPMQDVAAALAILSQGKTPLLLKEKDLRPTEGWSADDAGGDEGGGQSRRKQRQKRGQAPVETFRIEVGRAHDVNPSHIVGAIANEAGLSGRQIGRIQIEKDYSLVDLPVGMPDEVFKDLKKVWVCNQQLDISRVNGDAEKPRARRSRKPREPRFDDGPKRKRKKQDPSEGDVETPRRAKGRSSEKGDRPSSSSPKAAKASKRDRATTGKEKVRVKRPSKKSDSRVEREGGSRPPKKKNDRKTAPAKKRTGKKPAKSAGVDKRAKTGARKKTGPKKRT